MTTDGASVSGGGMTILIGTVTITMSTTSHIGLGASKIEPTFLGMSMRPVADLRALLAMGLRILMIHEEGAWKITMRSPIHQGSTIHKRNLLLTKAHS